MRPHNPNKGPKDTDESSDTFDTIDWLLKHVPGHNGKVGQWGISYPGFYTVAGMIDAHPALAAASPQAPVTDWFVGDDWHHNGALMLPHAFNFMANFGRPMEPGAKKWPYKPYEHGTPDGYRFFLDIGPLANADMKHFKGSVPYWNEVMRHGTYDDFWKARNVRQHVKAVKPAVLTVGGWYDAENLFGALETYKAAEAGGTKQNHLVMGPWVHGGWNRGDGDKLGDVSFAAKTGEYYREKIEFPFFERHLKGKADGTFPKAWVFETGTNRWRKFETWPPKEMTPTPLHPAGDWRLTFGIATVRGELVPPPDPPGADEFVSDPAKPVPFIGKTDIGMTKEYMTADQRFAASRPDVLVYQTGPLVEDVTIAGPIEVELYVSTTGTDADWVVKVIDVYPDDHPDPDPNPREVRLGGYQQLVRGDVMRGKFRNSFEKPEPFEPGKVTRVKFALPDVLHTFRPGHRVMVQVQSTWFPLVDRNPQTFCDIYTATEADFKKQTHRIHRGPDTPSRVVVPVIR
jgi:putative CocE/NonD family hydrolase